MKLLKDLIKRIEIINLKGETNIPIHGICFDSRVVKPGYLFVAINGTQTDGHNFIPLAIEKGATAILCEQLPSSDFKNVCLIKVKDSSYCLGVISSEYYDNPSSSLKLIGVTGTNGKTTTVTLLYNIFRNLGYKAGLLSTVKYFVNDREIEASHTTPDALQINKLMAEMVSEGCTYCFMEVSSHSVVQHRIAGLIFAGGVFSNLTHDHLDFHKTFDEYLKAKQLFFTGLSANAFVLTNIDDKNGKILVQNSKAIVKTYSLHSMSDFRGKVLESHFDGSKLLIDGKEVWSKFIGEFNAYNILAVYSTAILLGENSTDILRIISSLNSVPGRFEYIRSRTGVTAIVDYAHTPDGLDNVLRTINQIRNGGEQLITVVGAGGDRDRTKRPIMARIAVEQSTKLILTSDNPRSEDPEAIIDEMLTGISIDYRKKVMVITNRKEAIKTACMFAQKGDIILVAGKGHENYQEIKGVKHHFDDKEVINEFFNLLSNN